MEAYKKEKEAMIKGKKKQRTGIPMWQEQWRTIGNLRKEIYYGYEPILPLQIKVPNGNIKTFPADNLVLMRSMLSVQSQPTKHIVWELTKQAIADARGVKVPTVRAAISRGKLDLADLKSIARYICKIKDGSPPKKGKRK